MSKNNENLSDIFDKGIRKTWFKSHILDKINELRGLMDMLPRNSAIPEGHYDSQVVEKLKVIDFSPLDTVLGQHNSQKFFVLNFSGIGFQPAELVIDHRDQLEENTVKFSGNCADNFA
jgi:hypothetical protein